MAQFDPEQGVEGPVGFFELPDLREDFAMGPPGGVPPQFEAACCQTSTAPDTASAVRPEVLRFCYGPTPWPPCLESPFKDLYTQLAALAKARLLPNLNLYLEYSNELWNDMFAQSQ